ncbi:MAG: riboflavin synthase [Fusobacteriia bacterium 4572_132]|nr:MAG: riboflavin synthase [Fusobacteriia bacterium 4572_132]
MFTGLIEEKGKVLEVQKGDNSLKIKISAKKVLVNAKKGDSIATNGVCLTAIEVGNDYFVADAMAETVNRTNLKRLKKGELVNLEKSITLATPLGGHLVTGDVDCEGIIKSIKKDGIAKIYEVDIDEIQMKYVVQKGRISIDGASLTVMGLTQKTLSVSLIPHTQEEIILGSKKVGDYVNIETDLIGKHVEKLLGAYFGENKLELQKSNIDMDFLARNGFC